MDDCGVYDCSVNDWAENENSVAVAADDFTSGEDICGIEQIPSIHQFDEVTATNSVNQFELTDNRNSADDEEREARYQLFKQNHQINDQRNCNGRETFRYGIADYTQAKFQQHSGIGTQTNKTKYHFPMLSIPDMLLLS